MPIYLYLKTHQVTGLKYLGKTKKDPYKYKGSGVEWKKHLRVYGNDVATEVIRECATDEELSKWGKYYSVIFDVVNSPEFLNRIPETGIGHGCLGNKHSEETKQKISEANKGKVRNKGKVPWNKGKKGLQVPWNKGKTGFLTHSEETKRKIGEASKVRNKGNVPWNKGKSYTLEGKRRRGKDKGKTRRKKLNA